MTHSAFRAAQRGFTMIELMVALMLGLLVVGAASSIFLSNQRVYGSTEAINRIQENQRSAFEMLTRDIREAGTNPCLRFTSTVRPILQLSAPDAAYWGRFADALVGTEAGNADRITLYSAIGNVYSVTQHKKPADPITVAGNTAGLVNGQLLMLCNTDYGIVFSASGVTAGGSTVGHDSAANCGTGFTPTPDPTKCTAASSGPGYCFWLGTVPVAPTVTDFANCPAGIGQSPAYIVAPTDALWTLEANGRNGQSLYRTVGGVRSEIAEGVTGLDISYKVGNGANYVSATAVADWSRVTAVHVQMTFVAAQGALSDTQRQGTNNAPLTRQLNDYIALRNHQDIQ